MSDRARAESLNHVFKLLATQGFDEHSAAHVARFNRRSAKRIASQQRGFERQKKRLSEVMKSVSPADRLVIGKFFAMKEAMAFDAGIRIGLSAMVTLNVKQRKERGEG